jgi:hypothetical protein
MAPRTSVTVPWGSARLRAGTEAEALRQLSGAVTDQNEVDLPKPVEVANGAQDGDHALLNHRAGMSINSEF